MKRVLVFPCGTEIGLEIVRALSDSAHFEVYGASSVSDHGEYVCENYFSSVPYVSERCFVEEINKIIVNNDIDFIFPAHDSVVLELSRNRDSLEAEVVTSCFKTCEILRSKRTTYEYFSRLISVPKVFEEYNVCDFPVFLKPDVGEGGRGTCIARNDKEVAFFKGRDSSLLILEYLPGKEYTVDCFTDKKGDLLFVGGRERVRVRNGISVRSQVVKDSRFQSIANVINREIQLRGAWFYQVKERNDGELVLLEASPRVSGTMSLFRGDGVNFSQLSLFDRMGRNVSVTWNDIVVEVDRALISRFKLDVEYSYVYVDFDDTIILGHNRVNTAVISFLYQCKNRGKKIIMLSKHDGDVKRSLKRFSICESLFDDIILIEKDKNKSDYIEHSCSIFVDDSFSERVDVYQNAGIPVFSLDMLETLMQV